VFYNILYSVGFTPWEEGLAQPAIAEQIAAMFDQVQAGREPPLGRVPDLGCGSGVHAVELSRRGWQVTGLDAAPRALARARERATNAGVSLRLHRAGAGRCPAAWTVPRSNRRLLAGASTRRYPRPASCLGFSAD